MKLDDLIDKSKMDAMDSLDTATRKMIEELAKKDPKTASGLSKIVLFTKSGEAHFNL